MRRRPLVTYITEDVEKEARRVAEKYGISVSKLIEIALRRYLNLPYIDPSGGNEEKGKQ